MSLAKVLNQEGVIAWSNSKKNNCLFVPLPSILYSPFFRPLVKGSPFRQKSKRTPEKSSKSPNYKFTRSISQTRARPRRYWPRRYQKVSSPLWYGIITANSPSTPWE